MTASDELSQAYNVLSSAKLQMSDFKLQKNRSFMNILNKIGPRIEPCGTPSIIFNHSLIDDPIRTRIFRFVT